MATLSLNAFVRLNIDLSVGYDTSGLIMLVNDIKNGGSYDPVKDILRGFYIDDTPTTVPSETINNIHFDPYTQYATGVHVQGGISATAGLLGLKVSGGVTALGSLSLNSHLDDGQHRIHLDQIIDGITSDPLSLFTGSGSIAVGLDLSYGFDTPWGDITLFDLNIAHAVIYDFTLGRSLPPPPPAPDPNTVYLHMTGANQVIYVHNFQNIRSVDGNGSFLDEWDGIEVDYNPAPNGQTSIPPDFIYTQHVTDSISGQTQTYYILPIDMIAMDHVTDGDHTVTITGDTYIYDTHHNDATNRLPSWSNLTSKDLDPYHTRGLNGGGLAVNAILVGGAGSDKFRYYGGGRAILVGGAGDNYLEGGLQEYGGVIPQNLFPDISTLRVPSDIGAELQTQIRLSTDPLVVGNNVLIGTPASDYLVGGDGTNEIDGEGGSDTEYGGRGNDQFRVDLSYPGSPQITGGGGTDAFTLSDVGGIQFFTPGAAATANISLQKDAQPDNLGNHAVDITVVGGPQIKAQGISNLGITSEGGPISVQNLSGTTLQTLVINSHSGSGVGVGITLHEPTDAYNSFFLSPAPQADGVAAVALTNAFYAYPRILVRGMSNRDSLTLADGGANASYYLQMAANIAFATNIQAGAASHLYLSGVGGTQRLNLTSSSSGTIGTDNSTITFSNVGGFSFTGGGPFSSLVISGGNFTNETYTGFSASTPTSAAGDISLGSASIHYAGLNHIDDLSYVTNLSFVADSLTEAILMGDGPVSSGAQTSAVTIGPLALFGPPSVASSIVNFANKVNVAASTQLASVFTLVELHVQPRGLKNLTLNPGVGQNSGTPAGAIVSATPSGVATTLVKTATGYVRFEVGDGGLNLGIPVTGALGILGPVAVVNDPSYDDGLHDGSSGTSLYILDASDATAHSVQIGRGYTAFNNVAQIQYIDTYRLNLYVNGSSGGSFYWVTSTGDATFSGAALTLTCGSGADTVDVAAFGHPFSMTVDGGAGVNTLNVGGFVAKPTIAATGPGSGVAYNSTTTVYYSNIAHPNATAYGLKIPGEGELTDSGGGLPTLLVEGDEAGNVVTDDTIVVRKDPNNPSYIEVLQNGATFPAPGVRYDGPANFNIMEIDTYYGQDEVDIQDIPAGMEVHLVERGTGVVNVGKNGSLSGILGSLVIVNPTDATAITIDDSADAANRTATIDNSIISGLTAFPISYKPADTSSLTIKGGTGQNIYNVLNTPNAGPDPVTTTTIVGNGPATVNIGNNGSAQGILGDLIIQNPLNATSIAVDDSADQRGRNVTLSEQSSDLFSLTGLTPATVYYLGSVMSSVVLSGGSGNDTFAIGPSLDDFGLLTVNGGGGSNSLRIDDSQGTGLPTDIPDDASNVQYSISYALTGQDVSRTAGYGYSLPNGGAGGVSFTDVVYSGMASLEVDGSSAGAALSVTNTSVPTLINGGIGDDNFTVGPSLDNLASTLTVNGGGGIDTLTVNDTQGTGLPASLPPGATNVHSNMGYAVSGQYVSRASSYSYSLPGGGGGGGMFGAFVVYAGIANLELDGSNVGADYSVSGASASTIVTGGGGHNMFTVGPSLDVIGLLTINGNANGNDFLLIDDTQGTGLPANLPANFSNVHAIVSYGITGGDIGRTASYSYTDPNGNGGGGTSDVDIVYTGMAILQLNGSNVGGGYSITSSSSPLYINGGSGHNAYTVGSSLDGVHSLYVSGNISNDTLTIDDTQGTGVPANLPAGSSNLQTSMYYIVTGQDVGRYTNYIFDTPTGTSSGASAAEIQYTDIASLEVDASNISAPLAVTDTSVPTVVNGGSGGNAITVGPALDSLSGPLSIAGHGGVTTLTIDDSQGTGLPPYSPAGSAVMQYTLSGTDVSRASNYTYHTADGNTSGSLFADVSYAGVSNLELDGGSVNSSFVVFGTAVPTLVNGGAGATSASVRGIAGGGALEILGLLSFGSLGGAQFPVTVDDSSDPLARIATLASAGNAGDGPWEVVSGLTDADIRVARANGAGESIISGSVPGQLAANLSSGGGKLTVSSGTVRLADAGVLNSGASLTVGNGAAFDPSLPSPVVALSSEPAPATAAAPIFAAIVATEAPAAGPIGTLVQTAAATKASTVARDVVLASPGLASQRTLLPGDTARRPRPWAWLATMQSSWLPSDRIKTKVDNIAALDAILAGYGT